MSSTYRSNARLTNISDYYVTPTEHINNFILSFCDDFPNTPLSFKDKIILDPCAGGDNITPMSYPTVLINLGYKNLETVDIRLDSRAEYKENYLSFIPKIIPDIIITNPPFNLALEIIKKALEDVKDEGLVIMLLRLNFFGSQIRHKWMKENMPFATYVHSKRMKFLNTSNTDSIEYMHAIWVKNYHPKFTQLRII